ncbi:MAG: ABC transporter ATP-binding protein [Candidatus Heimdallarchaeum endolithica]|uniref:ABC transporter ATP-binding protein n=1 Tax=Candidatus Heimdallarchaeum endolithica TaxID=2876572 RepID=A0A9Y1BS82_9ARCH|nr:MAG: ABC transporter ATP-binding protein [Candidatus Heimdallarchaeum endolithica]
MENIIEVKNLTKTYNRKTILSKLSFQVKKGELFTLIGPNGAGKTTLFKILTGQIKQDSGTARIFDINVESLLESKYKLRISYVPQADLLWDNLTVKENIFLMGKLYGLKKAQIEEKANKFLTDFNLIEHQNKLASKLSGGMKKKLSIAMSLMNDPLLLFLDEPTTGLDIEARTLLTEDLKKLKEEGITIILTTHLMEVAESLASKVLIIDKGKVVAFGKIENIINKFIGDKVLQVGCLKRNAEFEDFINKEVKSLKKTDYIRIKQTFFFKGEKVQELMQVISSSKFIEDIYEINIKKSSLKEAFLFITNKIYKNGNNSNFLLEVRK